jgi:UDP-2,3-diacylglucosamine hydrolase
MSKLYFISDAHLGLESREVEEKKESQLIAFLESIRPDATELYIVGDLFDAWFEYRTVIPKGFHRLFTAFDSLVRAGVTVHYVAGNHDYWIRDFFSEELGMVTHHDPLSLTANGLRVYVHHGDGVMPGDTGYRALKVILRNRVNIWLYSWLHPDLGIPLARMTSKKSRHYTAQKDYGEQDGMLLFAKSKIEEGFDVVIMGHRHKALKKPIGTGTYINLGDWITHCTYAELSPEGVFLKEWRPARS